MPRFSPPHEERLHELAGVTESTLVVTSVPDHRRGERPVVPRKLDEALRACLERLAKDGMPSSWKPRGNSFFRIESFPQPGSGKLDLQRIRELARLLAS